LTGASLARAWCGICIVFLICFTASLDFFEVTKALYEQSPDPWGVGQQEERFAAVRADLGAPSLVGYYSDVRFEQKGGQAVFFSALYTMAPHLLVADPSDPKVELVIGNFHQRPDLGELERKRGLKLVKDYGRGVMLFRREKD